jgi:L-alanine-DL-glutamate epimerase-like enolase superfamily enzyme
VVSNVRLAVYDLLGREVAVLVDEEKEPGEYMTTWDARGMASGVYLYRLTAGETSVTKMMLLLR